MIKTGTQVMVTLTGEIVGRGTDFTTVRIDGQQDSSEKLLLIAHGNPFVELQALPIDPDAESLEVPELDPLPIVSWHGMRYRYQEWHATDEFKPREGFIQNEEAYQK